ncbi:hypothetical protein J2I47_06345 [Fibrella sp. HMF5335]|uniref:DUF4890 domain-containing protein n=1 Tax=Fibrella rubiginis TaxID=2817060 RepID=A0A939K4G6_9BACT|nr:hypothetical protein [Fibrella rubiginis]MBO0936161.1 hypothetical protein [Fibrella rubiginis]
MTIRKMILTGAVLLATATTATFAQTQPVYSGHQHLTPEQKMARKAEMKAKLAAMSPAEREAFRQAHREHRQAKLAAMSPEKRQRVLARRQLKRERRQQG